MSELINPYIAGSPVEESSMFFGRQDVFDWIQRSLSGQFGDNILVIHGQRRVGKTSVLKQLGNRLPEKYIPVFFDLQGRTGYKLDQFLLWLAREIRQVLLKEHNIVIPKLDKKNFIDNTEYFETTFLPEVRTFIGNRSLLLTFDEFDNLEESDAKDTLAGPLIDYLRRLMGQEGLNFIFSIGSSGRKLENMQASYTEFFKSALLSKISFLSEEQTRQLIISPVKDVLTFEPQAIQRIYEITSGQPYFTQLICYELFALCQSTGQRTITKDNVEAVLLKVIERGSVNLKFTWDEAEPMEKWCIASLAHMPRETDKDTLENFLHEQQVKFHKRDLTRSLLGLREKDVLTKNNQFVVELLKLWLQENRSIEQVANDVGLDVRGTTSPPPRRLNRRTVFASLGVLAILAIAGGFGWPAIAPALFPETTTTPTMTLAPSTSTSTPSPSQTPTNTATVTVTPTPTLGVGSTQISEKDGIVMSYIPEGEFTMGSDDSVEAVERPAHNVYLDAFWFDQTEVTNAMYSFCIQAGICNEPNNATYFSDPNYSDHPVVYVSWNDASAYCIWAGRKLPTEAQWEKAARGGLEGMNYSWGNELPTCVLGASNGAQVASSNGTCRYRRTAPVASFAPNGYGIYDTIGNVGEWVADMFSETYYQESPFENPTGPISGQTRARRGSAYSNGSITEMLIYRRGGLSPISTSYVLGFRCAQPVSP